MITCRRDKARLLETMELDRTGASGTTGKRIRRSIANLCRLAIEISRAGDHAAKLELALEYLLRELPVNQAAVLLLPTYVFRVGRWSGRRMGIRLSGPKFRLFPKENPAESAILLEDASDGKIQKMEKKASMCRM